LDALTDRNAGTAETRAGTRPKPPCREMFGVVVVFREHVLFCRLANARGNARAEWRGACFASAVTRGPSR